MPQLDQMLDATGGVMTIVHVVIGLVIFVIAAGLIGYAVADYLDKKYGTDDS